MDIRKFALGLGVLYLVIGILGFVPGIRQSAHHPETIVDSASGFLLGLFAVNILHNLFHIAIGAWGVYAYQNLVHAKQFCRGVAIIYGVLTVFGLIPVLNNFFGLIPLFGHNVWLHAVTAIAAGYFGFRTSETTDRLGRDARPLQQR